MSGADDEMVDIPTDVPTSARVYSLAFGGKDSYEVDRQFVLSGGDSIFPEGMDLARENRLFLYRAVRYLMKEAGVRQFLDMGCGLPTDNNVHQVAQEFAPASRVVYVDNDPIVLAHGRALLGTAPHTTVITADMREPQAVLDHPDVHRLVDFNEPLAVLFLSVGHHLTDADDPSEVLRAILAPAVSGSYVAFTQVVSNVAERRATMNEVLPAAGMPWQTRTPAEVDALLDGLEPVEPGLVDIDNWRPDPDQPPLPPPDPIAVRFIGVTDKDKGCYEYGGVLRKP